MPELMTTQEVAELLRRSTETMRYWRWQGIGPPSFKIGRRVMYRRAEVERWLAEQEKAAA